MWWPDLSLFYIGCTLIHILQNNAIKRFLAIFWRLTFFGRILTRLLIASRIWNKIRIISNKALNFSTNMFKYYTSIQQIIKSLWDIIGWAGYFGLRFWKFKGIGSILFLKNGLKKNCRKNYKNNLRSNNCEICTAVALCFPNILDVMVLENMNLSSDRNRATVKFVV
jgi:hypothetical protein